jgi:1-acyl-sn-glycerol-3-phosphate acyltransferase
MSTQTTQVDLVYPVPRDSLLSAKLMKRIRLNQRLSYWFFRPVMLVSSSRTRQLLSPEELKPGIRYVIAANHQSMIDPFIICYAMSPGMFSKLVPFRYFAHNALFDKILTSTLISLGAFPASRNKHYAYGLKGAEAFLKHNQTTMIFPEGKRTPSRIRPRSGVEVLAKQPNVEIIPVHIQWRKNRLGWRSYQLTIGRPLKEKNLSARQILNRIYKLPLKPEDWPIA